jgi:hypothetical protein
MNFGWVEGSSTAMVFARQGFIAAITKRQKAARINGAWFVARLVHEMSYKRAALRSLR